MELTEREVRSLWNAAYMVDQEHSWRELKTALDKLTKVIWTPRSARSMMEMEWRPKKRQFAKR